MSHAWLALLLALLLGGLGLFGAATSDYGNIWDPNGATADSDSDYGNHWDPDGATSDSDSDYGSHWDPNG